MALSSLAAATRALVSVLLVLSRSYLLVLTVNRDSSPEQLLQAYRKVLLKVHPDKGGKKDDSDEDTIKLLSLEQRSRTNDKPSRKKKELKQFSGLKKMKVHKTRSRILSYSLSTSTKVYGRIGWFLSQKRF